MQFNVEGDTFDCTSAAAILSGLPGGAILGVYHDPAYKPEGNWTRSSNDSGDVFHRRGGFFKLVASLKAMNKQKWFGWWYISIGAGFALLALRSYLEGVGVWAVVLRGTIAVGFAALGAATLRSRGIAP